MGKDEGLVVLLMATSETDGFLNAIESLRRNEIEYRVLEMGKRFLGWRHRMQVYRDAAASYSATRPILCMDSYDALSMRPLDDNFYRTINAAGDRLILSLECACGLNCVPITKWWNEHPSFRPKENNFYVNGGLVLGRAKRIQHLYDWMLRTNQKDDQVGLARYALKHTDAWIPDVDSRIMKNNLFLNQISPKDRIGSGCYFVHFPALHAWSTEEYNATAEKILGNKSKRLPVGGNWGSPQLLILQICAIIIMLIMIVLLAKKFFTEYRLQKRRRISSQTI